MLPENLVIQEKKCIELRRMYKLHGLGIECIYFYGLHHQLRKV